MTSDLVPVWLDAPAFDECGFDTSPDSTEVKVDVPRTTLERWQRVEREYREMQLEIRRLVALADTSSQEEAGYK